MQKINILTIPKGPVEHAPKHTKSNEIIPLSDLDTHFGIHPDTGFTSAPTIPDQFNILAKTHALYLDELPPHEKENLEFLTGKHNYEIKTNGGGRIFVASDVSESRCLCHGGTAHHESFSFNVYDYVGRQVLTIDGHLGGCGTGACVKISTANSHIGSIIQGGYQSPHYLAVNWQGKEIYSIHHGVRGSTWHNLKLERTEPHEFGIYSKSEIEKKLLLVGTLSPIETRCEICGKNVTRESVKLTYPPSSDLHGKLILLGALFVVDYRIIKREGRLLKLRGHQRCNRMITIPCLGITFGLVLAICVITVLIYELVVHLRGEDANHTHDSRRYEKNQ